MCSKAWRSRYKQNFFERQKEDKKITRWLWTNSENYSENQIARMKKGSNIKACAYANIKMKKTGKFVDDQNYYDKSSKKIEDLQK